MNHSLLWHGSLSKQTFMDFKDRRLHWLAGCLFADESGKRALAISHR